jgi:nucleotide-binding universal stress UspA family protein
MILICYDGSPDAKAAIARGGELLPGQSATLLAVWQPFLQVAARAPVGFGVMPSIPDSDEVDRASAQRAHDLAEEGAELARAAGFDVEPRSVAQETTVARAILRKADSIDADAILIGSRGLTGIKSLLLGSVSHEVVQRADRTVIVVPSSEVASARSGQP